MGETAESLYRRGAISPKQASKLGVLKKTSVERPDEEEFQGKQGRKDQGEGKERGHKVAHSKHIDGPDQGRSKKKNTGFSPDRSLDNSGQPGVDEIDRGSSGKGGKNSKSWPTEGNETNAKQPMNKRSKGKIAKQGPLYGGGGRNTQ